MAWIVTKKKHLNINILTKFQNKLACISGNLAFDRKNAFEFFIDNLQVEFTVFK